MLRIKLARALNYRGIARDWDRVTVPLGLPGLRFSCGCEFDANGDVESVVGSIRLQRTRDLYAYALARLCALERKQGSRSYSPVQHPVPQVLDIRDMVSKINGSDDHLAQPRR